MTDAGTIDGRYDVVVVGGGVAAGACVTTLCEEGFEGTVAVFASEPHPPYTRPGLSKAVLRGEKPLDAPLMHPEGWYAEHGVTLVTGTAVTNVDRLGATVRAAGRTVGYGTLVLATGAEPRRVPVPDDLADRVHVLRSISDCEPLCRLLDDGASFLVVGGGFIGAEFACSARMKGCDATLVFPEEVVMERAFGDIVGAWFSRRLESQGIELRSGSSVRGMRSEGGRVSVTLTDGEEVVVDHVLVGIGVTPATGLAAQAGLELAEGGVQVDEHLRTEDERIYAIGDIAAYSSELHGGRVRIEHWDVARAHGVHVAKELLGAEPGAYRELPYFFSGMGDWAFAKYVGTATTNAVLRTTADVDSLSAVYVDGEQRMVGIIVVGEDEDFEAAKPLVPGRPKVDVDRIAAGDPIGSCVLDAAATR